MCVGKGRVVLEKHSSICNDDLYKHSVHVHVYFAICVNSVQSDTFRQSDMYS